MSPCLELTQAYAILANAGRKMPPVAITRILDHEGNVVYEHAPQPGEQVVRVEHAFLISSILADNQARTPAFGPEFRPEPALPSGSQNRHHKRFQGQLDPWL